MVFLAACGDSEEQIAADYRIIAQATCFLNGFEPKTTKYVECVDLIANSLGAQARRNADIERAVMQQQIAIQTVEQAAESLNNAMEERRAARQGTGAYAGH